jgi:surface polysaccharide O-acyltransferase-like enzyme
MTKPAPSRHNYIDVLRVVASLMVIATHVMMHYITVFKVHSIPWTMLMVGKVTTLTCVPVFFMISGATIYSSTREESYTSFIKRRLSRVAIPFVIYAFFYYLFYAFVKHEFTFGILDFFKQFLGKNIQGHLWYLYALVPLYFFYPMIKKLVQNLSQKALLTLIIAFFTIDSLIPLLNQIFALFSDFDINIYSFGRMGVYLNYTLLGYYIHTYVPATKKNGLIAGISGALAAVAIVALTYYTSVKKMDEQWIDILLAFVFIQSIGVMLLAKCAHQNKVLKPFAQKALSTLGALSFSAYLIHMLILRTVQLNISKDYMATVPNDQAALLIAGIYVGAVILSYLWSFLVSKIPFLNKIL